jgi:phage recombination protein Bet
MGEVTIAHHVSNEIDANRNLIKETFFREGTAAQFHLFLEVAKKVGLSPLNRQITPLIRRQKQKDGSWEAVMTIITNIDGFRLIAERSGKYAGQKGPYWCGTDGEWKEVWTSKENPAAAKVGVLRSDFKDVLWAVARWDSYVQTYFKDGKEHVSPTWKKMPDLMLAKVAEALALRKAFPNDLSGLYSKEEMDQVHADEPAQPKDITPPKQDPETTVELANFVIPFGKFKGQQLCDIDYSELASWCDWMAAAIESDKKSGKKTNPKGLEVFEIVDRWLMESQSKAPEASV